MGDCGTCRHYGEIDLDTDMPPEFCKTCTAKKPDDESYDPAYTKALGLNGKFRALNEEIRVIEETNKQIHELLAKINEKGKMMYTPDEFNKIVNMDQYDNVNHPYHYTSGKFECIDVMEDAFGPEEVRMFCKLNAFKYLWRAAKKDNYIQDLKKARWYLDKCIKLTEGKDENSNTLAGEAECNRD